MIKAFFGLIIALVAFDMAFRHGVGTHTVIEFITRGAHAFSDTLKDSVFSH
ncbi:MAG: hypothetical protein WC816_13415 [Sphingomonas sp.]|jgi:hypothetical protein